MSDSHTIGDYTSNANVGASPVDTDNATHSSMVTAGVGETAMVSATYKGAGATVESAEAYLWAQAQYAEFGLSVRKNPGDALPASEILFAADASGDGDASLTLTRGAFSLDGFDVTGASTATFTAANAPAAIQPRKWLKVSIGGVAGYIPWFST